MTPLSAARPIRTLLIEDDEDDYILTRDLLADIQDGDFPLAWARSYEDGLAQLQRREHEVALVDYRLGTHTGVELLRSAKALGVDTPIILLTGQGNRDVDLQAMHAGAAYYLAKATVDAPTLERTIRYAVEMHLAHRALLDSEAHTRAILDSAVDGMITIDANGMVQTFNPAATKIFGYSEAEVIGKPIAMLMPPNYADHHDSYLERYQRTGEARIVGGGREVAGRRKDGSVFPLDLAISEVRYRGEQQFLGITRDLTERKLAEAELRNARSLAQQRERLADIGAITARIVHDIGNPVASIEMQTQLLIHKLDKDPELLASALRQPIERIQKATRHLDRLVKEFLDFSRDQRLDLARVHLPSLIDEVVADWQPLAANHDIALSRNISSNIPPLLLDPEKIRRVFENLIRNAVEAIGQGPGMVAVDAQLDGDGAVHIAVEDSGPGIAPGVQPFRLFETTKEHGSGLGLAIVHQFIQAHGGTIDYSSRQPHGTVFHVQLPYRS